MASKLKLAARRLRSKRDQSTKPGGKSKYAQKVRLGPQNNPRSPFYSDPLHRVSPDA